MNKELKQLEDCLMKLREQLELAQEMLRQEIVKQTLNTECEPVTARQAGMDKITYPTKQG